MLEELAKTGLAHQLVLTKLDRAAATVWNELGAALRHNPLRVAPYTSAVRVLPGSRESKSLEELRMGVWGALRGKLGFACDDTVLGVSSVEGWGITALRCSMLKACGAFREHSFDDNDQYLKALQETPIIGNHPDVTAEEAIEVSDNGIGKQNLRPRRDQIARVSNFKDDNPMRGKVFGGEKMIRKKIYRW